MVGILQYRRSCLYLPAQLQQCIILSLCGSSYNRLCVTQGKRDKLSIEFNTLPELYELTLYTLRRPYAISENDWIAVKMVDLYSELSVLCNATSDFCTESTCPTMRAGLGYEYTWADLSSSDYATPTSVPARRYMELLMTWVDKNLNTIGGSSSSQPAGSFNVNIKIFCRRLFRVYAHVFCQHFVETSSIHTHLKYSLFHFILFMREYGLLVSEIEVLPLRDIIDSLGIPNLHFPCQ